jgi:hypothetical protein
VLRLKPRDAGIHLTGGACPNCGSELVLKSDRTNTAMCVDCGGEFTLATDAA